MLKSFLIFLVLSSLSKADDAYKFAIDISNTASSTALQCLYDLGYDVAFIQIYSFGTPNLNGIQSIKPAVSAKLGIELFVTPAPSGKTGADQFTEAVNAVKAQGIAVKSIWLQVANGVNWSNSIATNILIIQGFITQARASGATVGIYTNYNDWQQITGNYIDSSSLRLWYYNVLGAGDTGESPANFDDFRAFGQWTSPNVKQFAQNEILCGISVNRNVYPNKAKKAVGGIV